MKRVILAVLLLALLAAGGYALIRWRQSAATPAFSYRLASALRQDVVSTISATGTIVPEDVVDVGAQVNGQIASFGDDADGRPVDYRSSVAANSVLARIDDALYAAQVASDEASLSQASAAVLVAQSQRDLARARLYQTERDWNRAQKLGESQALSQADYDASKSNYEQAVASLAVAEAQIVSAGSQVEIAKASLQRSRRNLFYCTITSPVDGVIIDRRVEIGQTVVSSLNAPSLFLIAKDLSRMQVLVQVNEADIGNVKPGERVFFAVDALPGERFEGEVRKVRLNATMTQNVVTFTVEIVTDNSALRLLPYLTANVRFVVDRREQALVVPNAALRWAPRTEQALAPAARPTAPGAPGGAAASGSGAASSAPAASQRQPADAAMPRQGGGRPTGALAGAPAASAAPPASRGPSGPRAQPRVWVLREGAPTAITVRAGLSDGTFTEVITDELKEGDEVIVGEVSASAAASGATTNPFAPQIFRGGGGGARPAGR